MSSGRALTPKTFGVYLKGFGKGLLVVVVFLVLSVGYGFVYLLHNYAFSGELVLRDTVQFQTVIWLLGYLTFLSVYLRKRLKKYWLLFGFLFSIFSLPFIYGYLALEENAIKKLS